MILKIGSEFKPFSYEQMIAPLDRATTEHNLIEESLGELAAKAGVWDKLANQQNSPEAYAQYKAYADDLTKHADLLAQQGLTPESRKGLLNMKRRYSSEIAPIEIAANKLEELTKSQREAIQKDPSLMFDINYGTSTIDDVLNKPNATYKTISGSELTKRASAMAQNLAKTIQDNPQYSSILGGQYFQQMQQLGYSPQQVMQTIMNDPNAPKELKQIADTIWKESGLDSWDQATQERAREHINSGLYDAIGTQRYDTQANRNYVSDIETERADMVREQFEWQKEKWKEDRLGVEMPDGSRVKDLAGGRVRVTYPDGKFEIISASNSKSNESSIPTNKRGEPIFPIIVDKASWGSNWDSAAYEGEDKTGATNWFDFHRKTRDWGADARLPKLDEMTAIPASEVPRKALQKIMNKVGSSFNIDDYDFYDAGATSFIGVDRDGIVAIPKGYLKATNKNTESVVPQIKSDTPTTGTNTPKESIILDTD